MPDHQVLRPCFLAVTRRRVCHRRLPRRIGVPATAAAGGSDQNRSGPVPVDRTLTRQRNGTG